MKNGFGLVFLRMRIGRARWLPAIFLLATAAAVWAADFTYTINSDNTTITITGYTGPAGDVVIPSTIDGRTVTMIGDHAFEYSDSLTSVTIGNSVTNIGNYACNKCPNLNAVTIGNSVTSIGDAAFYNCIHLARVTIGKSVTSIGRWAFNDCNRLASITIPNSVTSIGGWAFWNCRLASVAIPDSVTSIGDHAFDSCFSLVSATIGNGVTSIAGQAFYCCSSLASVTIGNSVTSIGDSAFDGCTGLADVYCQGNAPSLGLSVFNGDDSATVYYLPGTTGWGPTFGGRPTVLWNTPPPSAPTGVSASHGTYLDKVQVIWNAASGATGYQVFRHTVNNSASADQVGIAASATYDDTGAVAGTTYYYWVKAVNMAGASSPSIPDTGFIGVIGPLITANGLAGDVYLDSGDPVTIAVQMMNIDAYVGFEYDWWVVAFAHSGGWYYLESSMQWPSFNGDLAFCRPVFHGFLFNLASTPVLNAIQLPRGTYDFWFAIDYPMDGILDPNGLILFNKVTAVVQ